MTRSIALTDESFLASHTSGPFSLVEHKKRAGLLASSIQSRILIPDHNLNKPCGTLILWVMAMEDLACQSNQQHIRKHDPLAYFYSLVSDSPEGRQWTESRFNLLFVPGWYPQFFVKFGQGAVYPDLVRNRIAFALAGHFSFQAHVWYQFAISWDDPGERCAIYANGVRIARENQFRTNAMVDENERTANQQPSVRRDCCGDQLFLGNTAMAFSEVSFLDRFLEPDEATVQFTQEEQWPEPELTEKLAAVYLGKGTKPDTWEPGSEWRCSLDLTLDQPDHLERFYVQGNTRAPRITAEGLEVHNKPNPAEQSTTLADFQDELFARTLSFTDPVTCGPVFRESEPDEPVPTRSPGWARKPVGSGRENQVYLWTRQFFRGDLVLEFDFLLKKDFGLALLCLQATGMQGEDFMKDYPPRTSGSMSMVVWENIRNYHWEWFREMGDTYNVVNTQAVCKQPWMKPLAYACQPDRLRKNEWHRLRFVQDGGMLYGSIDGQILWTAEDQPNQNAGPVYHSGHIGFRCMLDTHLVYRNLKIWNRNPPFVIKPLP
jgi:hypothetical protein